MDALEYLEIKEKICKNKSTCEGCYLEDCYEYETDNPQKAINLVQKWKEENSKTCLSELRKALHDVDNIVIDDIIASFCPWLVFPNLIKYQECVGDCKKCWSGEILMEDK